MLPMSKIVEQYTPFLRFLSDQMHSWSQTESKDLVHRNTHPVRPWPPVRLSAILYRVGFQLLYHIFVGLALHKMFRYKFLLGLK